MNTPMSVPHNCSCLENLKGFFRRLFGKADPFRPSTGGDRAATWDDEDRPITTQEAADLADEDSFPASDPPSYTGGIAAADLADEELRHDGTPCDHTEDRPIATQEAADRASEDSFPASDPPSYTGGIT